MGSEEILLGVYRIPSATISVISRRKIQVVKFKDKLV